MTAIKYLQRQTIGEYFNPNEAKAAIYKAYGNDWVNALRDAASSMDCKLRKNRNTGMLKMVRMPEDEDVEYSSAKEDKLKDEAAKELNNKSVNECEIANSDTTVKTTVITREDGKQVKFTTTQEVKTVVKAEIIRDVNEVWGKGKGGFICMPRINRNALRATIKDCKERDTMYYTIDILAENMSPNNFITDTVNNNYLNEKSEGYLSERTLKRNKPLQKLVELDLIALNKKKQCMLNPIIACAYTITEDNMNDLARMYEEFKADGKFNNPVYKGKIPKGETK